jgi:short subunit fatty acids transporter
MVRAMPVELVFLALLAFVVFAIVMALRWEDRNKRPDAELAEDWLTRIAKILFRS